MMQKSHEKSHDENVEALFGSRARAYVDSAVHAQGADLDAIEEILRQRRPGQALDLGAGGGHVSYRMAAYAKQVTAIDLSAEMLALVNATARDKGLANICTIQAPAERLPFDDGFFDFMACRFSAHHWRDLHAGVQEARRVMCAGAGAVFIDVYAPGVALFDSHLQAVELLHDTSHVRDYTLSEWLVALGRCGFALTASRTWRLRMDFPVWTARMGTPAELAGTIRALQLAASTETRAHFAIEDDGSFLLDVVMIEAAAE